MVTNEYIGIPLVLRKIYWEVGDLGSSKRRMVYTHISYTSGTTKEDLATCWSEHLRIIVHCEASQKKAHLVNPKKRCV